jgi:hypothetical protein
MRRIARADFMAATRLTVEFVWCLKKQEVVKPDAFIIVWFLKPNASSFSSS